MEATVAEATEHLQSLLAPFSRHVYNVRLQFKELKYLKENLPNDKIIIHEDFSKNFQVKQQREVMASHWTNENVTVFTAVVYYKEDDELKHSSYAIVSDDLFHEKGSIYAFNKAILTDVCKKVKVNKVHYWSDEVWSQFKNRFNLTSIIYHPLDFGCEATWNFFETSHGKGAPDGVGAVIKRSVWRAILHNRDVINSAQEFASVASKECQNVEVLYVSAEDVNRVDEELSERWDAAEPIPATRSIHFVERKSSSKINVSKNSQFALQDTCEEHCLITNIASENASQTQTMPLEHKHQTHEVGSKAKPSTKSTSTKSKSKPTKPIKIENRLPEGFQDHLSCGVPFTFPWYKDPVVSALLENSIPFRGIDAVLIDNADLRAVSAKYATCS